MQGSVAEGAERVLYILATLAQKQRSLSIAELVVETELPQSTLYRQIVLLKRWGFVVEQEGLYGPGPLCLQLASSFDRSSLLIHEAQTDLGRLAAESGDAVGLMIAVKDQAVCLDMVPSQHSLRCSVVKGRGLPLSRGSSAKSLLAYSPARSIQTMNVETARVAPEQDRFELELLGIRVAGYAVSEGEVDAGVWGVSAPIFQRPNHAIASITLMSSSARVVPRTKALVRMTVAAAERISLRLQSR